MPLRSTKRQEVSASRKHHLFLPRASWLEEEAGGLSSSEDSVPGRGGRLLSLSRGGRSAPAGARRARQHPAREHPAGSSTIAPGRRGTYPGERDAREPGCRAGPRVAVAAVPPPRCSLHRGGAGRRRLALAGRQHAARSARRGSARLGSPRPAPRRWLGREPRALWRAQPAGYL